MQVRHYPELLLKSYIAGVKSEFEYDVVEMAKHIQEFQGDEKLALDLLKFLVDRFERDMLERMEDRDEP